MDGNDVPKIIPISAEPNRNLTIDILSCGETVLELNSSFKDADPDYFVIVSILKGRMFLSGEEYNGMVEEGCSFVLFPDCRMGKVISAEAETTLVWVGFTGCRVELYYARGNVTHWHPFIEDEDQFVQGKILDIYRKAQTFPNRYCAMASYMYQIFSHLLEMNPGKTRINLRSNAAYIVCCAIEKFKISMPALVSIDSLSASFEISRKQLNTVFEDVIGISPKKFYTQLRMEKACEMLRKGDYSIGRIAYDIGYSDQFNFAKAFKTLTGLTPSEYREGNEYEKKVDCDEIYRKLSEQIRNEL